MIAIQFKQHHAHGFNAKKKKFVLDNPSYALPTKQ